MKNPKKLVRSGISKIVKSEELETITDKKELNDLYYLKIQEELHEIISSEYKDKNEFVDLIQVAIDFAIANGFNEIEILMAGAAKQESKGRFSNLVLNNLNPNNPSNKIYFPSIS